MVLLAYFMLATYLNLLLILNTSPLVYIGLIFFILFQKCSVSFAVYVLDLFSLICLLLRKHLIYSL